MIDSEKTLDQISDRLIKYLRAELDRPMMDYDIPLAQMEGGAETLIYRFKLDGVSEELSKPLVLRLYPRFYGSHRAVWESALQNVLANEGYPVPRVHATCTDMSILGGAFFIMEFLEGETMGAPSIESMISLISLSVRRILKMSSASSIESLAGMLADAHASLHSISPERVIAALQDQGFEENRYRLDGRLYRLVDTAKEHAWLRDGVDWLINNRPPEPERLSICHGDFHPWNILVKDGKVTAVLDWPGFIVADPALDVASTTFLFTVLKIMYPEIDWMEFSEEYLDTYRTISSRDVKYLEYYRVLRCVTAFVDGIVGQELWTRPPIAEHLTKYIREATGIRMMPANQPQ